MSVVQRCPNCGTTRATPGECEACHDAQVRYYCTSHEPGIWLNGPTCPTCDARVSEAHAMAVRASVPVPTPAPGPPMDVRARSAAPSRSPVSVAPPSRPYRRPDSPDADEWGGRAVMRSADEERLEAGVLREALWPKILRAAVLARHAPPPAAAYAREGTLLGQLGGCLMRLVFVGVLLLLALAGVLYFLGRGLF